VRAENEHTVWWPHGSDGARRRRSIFRIFVPNPRTRLLLGERVRQGANETLTDESGTVLGTEADAEDFGYPGVSIHTDRGFWMNVRRKSVFQSWLSTTFQTKRDWQQYSSHNTYLSSARKFFIASNRDLIISTDTAMGAQMVGTFGEEVDTVDFNEHPTDKL